MSCKKCITRSKTITSKATTGKHIRKTRECIIYTRRLRGNATRKQRKSNIIIFKKLEKIESELNSKGQGFRNIKNWDKMARSRKFWISKYSSSTKESTTKRLSILRISVINLFLICFAPRNNFMTLKNTNRTYGSRQNNRKNEGRQKTTCLTKSTASIWINLA